jgi:putative ABC transport system substrate-binding protein
LTHRPSRPRWHAASQAAARQLGLRLSSFSIDDAVDSLESALAAIVRDRPNGLVVQPHPLTGKHGVRIAEFAVKNALPSMGGGLPFVTDGGLIAYGGDFSAGWRAAARYVDRILKGARPADLPVEQPTSFVLGLNLKTAKLLGVAVPNSLLLRADLVIR